MNRFKNVLVTGGAGYVGAILVPKLLSAGYQVTVLDLFLYGEEVLDNVKGNPNLSLVKGDIRDQDLLQNVLENIDAVIHLACISNDPSFELNPELGKSINYDAFLPLVQISKKKGVRRFIYASSSSVYGIKEEDNVTEDLPLNPLTDYSKYKMLCEKELLENQSDEFVTLALRPATVCGYSPRQRLDLTVNILTNHGYHNGEIKVFGGEQRRPNIHIEDITNLYVMCLEYDDNLINGKIFNVGYENHKVKEIASIVKKGLNGRKTIITTTPTDDNRSYHISSEKIYIELGFAPKHTIEEAVSDLVKAFDDGKLPNSFDEIKYFNIKLMQSVKMQ